MVAAARRLRGRDEAGSGAEVLQLAMCLPMAVIAVFATIQLGLAGYSVVTTNAAVEQAAWHVDAAALAKAQAAGDDEACRELIRDAVTEVSGGGATGAGSVLWAQNLTISPYTGDPAGDESYWYTGGGYGKTENHTEIRGDKTAFDGDGMMQTVDSIYTMRSDGCVRFGVSYEIPSLMNLPGLSGQVASKQVSRERVVESKMEVW